MISSRIITLCHVLLVLLVSLLSAQVLPNELQELPGEHDDFQSLRSRNKVYVDKSDYITELLQSENRFFRMCRPGRFGKSTFLQMLNAFFRGRKELFENLAVYKEHDWRSTYPVIYLDLTKCTTNDVKNLSKCLNREITQIGRSYGMKTPLRKLPLYPKNIDDEHRSLHNGNESKLGVLMDYLSENGKLDQSVVILIDEYDWIQHDSLVVRDFMHQFFSQFERMKQFIKFLFATCTVSTTQSPIAVKDLTFDPNFSKMMGLTGKELTSNMRPHIRAMIGKPNETFYTIVSQLRKRYNGYCFEPSMTNKNSDCKFYNFHSVISCLRSKNRDYISHPAGDLKNFIFRPFDTTEVRQCLPWMNNLGRQNSRESITVRREDLENENYGQFDSIPLVVRMVLHGYLTFRGYAWNNYRYLVDFPNDEIRESFRRAARKVLFGGDMSTEDFCETCKIIVGSMLTEKACSFVKRLNKLVFSRPELLSYEYGSNRIADFFQDCYFSFKEKQYKNSDVLHLDVIYSEADMSRGSYYSDGLKIALPNETSYEIQFEYFKTASCAMNELLKVINEESFRKESKSCITYLMGVNFNSNDRITDWIRITYFNGKCHDVQASHAHYLKMFSYVNEIEAYSPLPYEGERRYYWNTSIASNKYFQ